MNDEGAGVISTFVGTAIFLVFLLFAAQLLLGLYAESVVGAVAYDAAKAVAGSDGLSSRVAVEASARRSLGAFGDAASFTWSVDEDAVRLTVRVPRRGLLPGWERGPVERTVRVRAERVR